MEFTGIVRVRPGNIVCIAFGEEGEILRIAKGILLENPKGFDPDTMEVVTPLPPFKDQAAKVRYQPVPPHITIALDGEWIDEDDNTDKVTEEMRTIDGREIKIVVDVNDWGYLEANQKNDEATEVVFYMAFFLNEAIKQIHKDIRKELRLGPWCADGLPHYTMGGVRPIDGDLAKFRKRYCRPRPKTGLPARYLELAVVSEDEEEEEEAISTLK